jgi:hypothetical protein
MVRAELREKGGGGDEDNWDGALCVEGDEEGN